MKVIKLNEACEKQILTEGAAIEITDFATLKAALKDVKEDQLISVWIEKELPCTAAAIKNGGAVHVKSEHARVGTVKSKYEGSGNNDDGAALEAEIISHNRGMKGADDPEEKGLFCYGIKSGQPYLILQDKEHGGNAGEYATWYYIDGKEATYADVEKLYEEGIVTKAALAKAEYRPYSILGIEKIKAVKVLD